MIGASSLPSAAMPAEPARGGAGSPDGAMAVDRRTIALAGVRAARHELCRASGLLRRAIRVAATQDVAPQQLARAAGTSVDEVERIATGAGARAEHGAAC